MVSRAVCGFSNTQTARDCRQSCRYRGRGQSEDVGRARDVFAFGDRDKDLRLIKCHAAIPRGHAMTRISTDHHMNPGA